MRNVVCNRFTQHVAGKTEQFLGRLIDEGDMAMAIDGDHGIVRRIDHGFHEMLLPQPVLGIRDQ
jgi:hypothetical protein